MLFCWILSILSRFYLTGFHGIILGFYNRDSVSLLRFFSKIVIWSVHARVWMVSILPLVSNYSSLFFFKPFGTVPIPPTTSPWPSYSTVFSILWPYLCICLSFRFIVLHRNVKIHMTSSFFLLTVCLVFLSELGLYPQIQENFTHYTLLCRFWSVH